MHVAGPHRCLPFVDRSAFVAKAVAFLAEGIERRQRVAYIAEGEPDALASDLAELGTAAERVTIASIGATYCSGYVVDPDDQVAVYAKATAQALADGYTGYRVAAEATPLVRTPAQLAAFTTYEHRIDRLMAGQPFTAMCAYDVETLGVDAVADLACLHTDGGDTVAPFHLFATPEGIGLAGEIDILTADRFRWALGRVDPVGPALVVDMHELDFIDHRGLAALAEQASAVGSPAVLRGASSTVARVIEVLGLTGFEIEAAGAP